MSAHMLRDEDFQSISDWLFENAVNKSEFEYSIAKFIGFENMYEMRQEEEEKIKESVTLTLRNYYNLNRLSLVTRYGEAYDMNDNKKFVPKFSFHSKTVGEMIRKLKSLHYQCAEYLVSDTNLHKDLDIFIGQLCETVFEMKERAS